MFGDVESSMLARQSDRRRHWSSFISLKRVQRAAGQDCLRPSMGELQNGNLDKLE